MSENRTPIVAPSSEASANFILSLIGSDLEAFASNHRDNYFYGMNSACISMDRELDVMSKLDWENKPDFDSIRAALQLLKERVNEVYNPDNDDDDEDYDEEESEALKEANKRERDTREKVFKMAQKILNKDPMDYEAKEIVANWTKMLEEEKAAEEEKKSEVITTKEDIYHDFCNWIIGVIPTACKK